MNKQEFLDKLRKGLSGLPQDDVEERLTFYSEMLDDSIEEGLSEEEAVFAIGDVDEIVRQVLAEIPFAKIVKERITPKRHLKAWEIVLLVIGSPIWVSLAIAGVAVFLALYIVLWSLIISLWVIFGALAVCGVLSVPGCVIFSISVHFISGMVLLGVGLVCAGFSIFMFFGCREATKCILRLTKKVAAWIKKCFIKKEEA